MFKPLDEEHLMAVLEWRNQPANRAASYTSHVISWDEHRRWFEKTKADPSIFPFVFFMDGNPCGAMNITNFDPKSRSATWGFHLNSEGLGDRALKAWQLLEKEVVELAPLDFQLDRLSGESFVDNLAVVRLHKRLGFEVTNEFTKKLASGEERTVVETTLTTNRRKTVCMLMPADTDKQVLQELEAGFSEGLGSALRGVVRDSVEWNETRNSDTPELGASWPDLVVSLDDGSVDKGLANEITTPGGLNKFENGRSLAVAVLKQNPEILAGEVS